MSVRPATMRRLMRELSQLKSEPPEGIRVSSPDDNMLDVTGIIAGPAGTPYEGGYFRVKFHFTEEFPAAPPKCWFATKIFHPNVSAAGEICVNTLKKDWQASYGIAHILVTVKCLLIYPNPESALDEEAGKLLLENYDSYCSRARLITRVHATPKVRPGEFDTPSVAEATPSTTASTSSIAPTATPTTSLPSPALETGTLAIPSNIPFLPSVPQSVSSPPPSLSSPTLRKSASPSPPSSAQPLQSSGVASNTLPIVASVISPTMNDKEGKMAPSPLGTADANTPIVVDATATKAVKRPAGTNGGIGEKRKKALKRL